MAAGHLSAIIRRPINTGDRQVDAIINALLADIDTLTQSLQEATRERDEAMSAIRQCFTTMADTTPYQGASLWWRCPFCLNASVEIREDYPNATHANDCPVGIAKRALSLWSDNVLAGLTQPTETPTARVLCPEMPGPGAGAVIPPTGGDFRPWDEISGEGEK